MLIIKKKSCRTCGRALTGRQRNYCSRACKLSKWYAEHKERHAAASLRSYHKAKDQGLILSEMGEI